jgi:ribonuclease HI
MQAWKNSKLPPRVKTFTWRLIRRALATGMRASRFSTHIKKECARCGAPESDSHLFFHCSFARAVWFGSLGFKADSFAESCYPSDIIQQMISASHPEASVHQIMSILWNIWKAQNDLLFNKKSWSVNKVLFAASSLLSASTDEDQLSQSLKPDLSSTANFFHASRNTSFVLPAGPVAFSDVAFKSCPSTRVAGLGVYLMNPDHNSTIYIQASSAHVDSVLQAEAHALVLAGAAVRFLGWNNVTFLSDCKVLVGAAEAADLISKPGHWSARPILAEFFRYRRQQLEHVIRVPRSKNKIAHSIAKRALKYISSSGCSFTCKSSLPSNTCRCKMALCNLSFPFGKLQSVLCHGC